jgi:hypothetical protein
MKSWRGIMRILEVQHADRCGKVLYSESDVRNVIHTKGEEFILGALFAGQSLPSNYYIGLDSRSALEASMEISDVSEYEPIVNYYSRQSVGSESFQIITGASGHKQANSPTILFKAVGGSWGPVKNIFLADGLGYGSNCTLISSAALSRQITVLDGEVVTMRMAMALS